MTSVKLPKSNKTSSKTSATSFTSPKDIESIIPDGLTVLEKKGAEDYYSRFGISKILKLPIAKCQQYFQNHEVEIFK